MTSEADDTTKRGQTMTPADEPSVWLQDLTWEEVELHLAKDRVILIPCGSTEQHGPAGVLGVDTYVATGIVEDVAKRMGALCAPPLWFGDSPHHMAFAGTITLRTETLMAVVTDVCRSLASHGFDKIVLVNGHKGSNLPALGSAVRALHEESLPRVVFAVADPLHLARSVAPSIKEVNEHHGGELELSQVEYRYPGRIRMDRLTDQGAAFAEVFGGFVSDDLFGPALDGVDIIWSSAEQRRFAPTGSLSSSAGVTREKGKDFHEHIVGRLCELVDWMRANVGPIGGPAF
ncbi:creatininase family protein [Rhodococcus sp. MEB064]|uniref:creatininase family protein n=1 Tax=Rhodococcus sp. MEB064 TaxID=1587522 RepID=UPI000A52B297